MAKRLKFRLGAVQPNVADVAMAASLSTSSRFYEGVLPQSVDLTQHLGPQWVQGAGNTCVSHALAGLQAWVANRDGSDAIVSRWELYARAKQDDGFAPCGGTSLAAAARVLSQGVTTEAIAPYPALKSPCPYAELPTVPPRAARIRLNTTPLPRLSTTTTGLEVGAIKLAVASGSPVALSATVFASAQTDYWFSRGILAELPSDAPLGGHAVLVAGYQDDVNAPGGGWFLVRNSWPRWAAESPFMPGVGAISYQYVSAHAFEGRSLSGLSPSNPDPVACPSPYGGAELMELPTIYS